MKRGLRSMSTREAFEKSRVNIPNMSEAIWQPLYDYQTKTAAATTSQRFFVDPIGTAGKTKSDTNIDLSGQLPKGQAFQITGVQVELLPSVSLSSSAAVNAFTQDVYDFYNSGHLILKIGSKDYITQGNLMKFPPVNRLAIDSASGGDRDYGYGVAAGREFAIKDLLLESSQNFSVELNDLSAISAAARVGVTLNGFLFRNAQ